MLKSAVAVLIVFGFSSLSQACFPSKYWISCLIDTCKLGGSCPGDPTAKCRMDRTECDGCAAVWYTKEGHRANCSVTKDLQLCPGGEPVVHCKMDPCQWPCDHPKFKNAPCQKKYCGNCVAEYIVDGQWSQCPSVDPSKAGSVLPIDNVLNPQKVVGNCRMVPCSIDVCLGQRCPSISSAVCRPYACNECKPMWYLGDMPVDCATGDFMQGLPKQQQLPIVNQPGLFPVTQRTCKPGEPYVPCDQRACEGQMCRNYPSAICRPDGCGQCKATWYLDDQLVDCLSDQCPSNVPFVRCVDDPCKYFSHYCPTAECRASQCGKCEAKFFVNGNEIDCVMPPKACPASVEALVCPYFTCPANICPSNTRLMCRIDPCGTECSHEWVDIYNGEIRTCRTFERAKSPTKNTGTFKQPEMNKIFFKDPILDILEPSSSNRPIYVDKQSNSKFHTKEITTSRVPHKPLPMKDFTSQGAFPAPTNEVGGFRVEPVFVNQAPPIRDIDILALLRSFPHEVSVIPSSAIKKGLKKQLPKISGDSGLVVNTVPESLVQSKPARNFVRSNTGSDSKLAHQENPGVSIKQTIPVQENKQMLGVQQNGHLVPVKQSMASMAGQQGQGPVPRVPLSPLTPLSGPGETGPNRKFIELKHNTQSSSPQANKADSISTKKAEALLAELNNKAVASDLGQTMPVGTGPEFVGEPLNPTIYPELGQLEQNPINPTGQEAQKGKLATPTGNKKPNRDQSAKNMGGVPITMNMFSQWSSLP